MRLCFVSMPIEILKITFWVQSPSGVLSRVRKVSRWTAAKQQQHRTSVGRQLGNFVNLHPSTIPETENPWKRRYRLRRGYATDISSLSNDGAKPSLIRKVFVVEVTVVGGSPVKYGQLGGQCGMIRRFMGIRCFCNPF